MTTRYPITLTRRGAISGVGVMTSVAPWALGLMAVAAHAQVPKAGEMTAADYPVSERMTRLATYISQARNRPLPAEVREKTKWHVLDTLAAIVSGSQLPAGRAAPAFGRSYGGRPVSTVIGDTILLNSIDAAMVNGTMGHADETDDFEAGPWHPGINAVPTGLALGEQLRIKGEHFLRAVALGYDIGARVELAAGVALNFKAPTNSMGGVFGATATAACVAGLTEQQTRWALSYAAQQCSGIDSFRRDPDHIEKGFSNGGMTSRAGVTSALLVLAGFTAVNDIFSGPANFFDAYADTARPDLLVEKLGEDFYIASASFKRWPVGGPVQEPMDALQVLLKQRAIDPTQIQEVLIRQTAGWITDNSGPLAINVQHAVALMLVDGRLTFRSIHDKSRLKDPRIVRLKSVMRLVGGPLGQLGQGTDDTPVIQITFADGTHISQNRVPVRGSQQNPYTRDWVAEKARVLMTPVLGAGKTGQLIDHVLKLEDAGSILELRPMLQAKAGPPRLSDWPTGVANP